jgi:hypothetical protein
MRVRDAIARYDSHFENLDPLSSRPSVHTSSERVGSQVTSPCFVFRFVVTLSFFCAPGGENLTLYP